jgi:4-diphosphocytidyl-2-C-methyl-D-erythritol kinase
VTVVSARCPGKVNLQLSVGPVGADGYHPLVTVFQAVSVYDEVHATHAPHGTGISISVESERGTVRDRSAIPLDHRNLAWRAAETLADELGITPDVSLRIVKGIPVAGGMAGGSADAAAALVACAGLWGADPATIHDIAPRLGADVPFILRGGTAIGTGRGDVLTPAMTRGDLWWVFAVADGGLSTPAVYAEFDRLTPDPPPPTLDDDLLSALVRADTAAVGRHLSNDLQRAALSLRSSLARVLAVAEDVAALGAVVSGSGPTCALLARDEEHALDLAVSLTSAEVCRTVVRARGPVPGAHRI